MHHQKVVTSAMVLNYKASAIAVVVVVAVVFIQILAKIGVKMVKWEFATCFKSCYNCYKTSFFFKKVNTRKGLTLGEVVTTARNCYKLLQICYKLLQKLLQIVTA